MAYLLILTAIWLLWFICFRRIQQWTFLYMSLWVYMNSYRLNIYKERSCMGPPEMLCFSRYWQKYPLKMVCDFKLPPTGYVWKYPFLHTHPEISISKLPKFMQLEEDLYIKTIVRLFQFQFPWLLLRFGIILLVCSIQFVFLWILSFHLLLNFLPLPLFLITCQVLLHSSHYYLFLKSLQIFSLSIVFYYCCCYNLLPKINLKIFI